MKDKENREVARRKVLKRLLVGGGVAAGAKMMPDEWHKPVVESVILPAHAETSQENRTQQNVTFQMTEDDETLA